MKLKDERPWADSEKAARRIMEHAHAFVPIQDGRIYIEKINRPMIDEDKATPAEYWAGLTDAREQGWLEYHESGTFVRMKEAAKDMFLIRNASALPPAAPLRAENFMGYRGFSVGEQSS
ncbi:hypothetical protein [Bradyrhizobium sp. RD5-C2]|uniref:hypothetical protein n=1 Tax=Bradyrhizobium sp. RD5-C2 TaxID=244562 RepID=UPI001CC505CA|nr:hypothetical protein [Bradyrhizobium sp. RD5-C2]GIQ78447.1 hypothetical protein BraRD5C2_68980 [Bradyrhizobium sp. RD5-C2]